MTISFDVNNLEVRQVITPDGIGTLFAIDDKDNPTMASVTVKVDGYKVPQTRVYDIEDLQEIGGRNG